MASGKKAIKITDSADRLAEFYRRLAEAPPASSPGEALEQVRSTLNGVEDEMSGVPYYPVPALNESNGRMYPPFDDRVYVESDGSLAGITSGHRVELGLDGSVTITARRTGETVFTKSGSGIR